MTIVDLVIRNGLIVDGTGEPPRIGDVAVSGGSISSVGSFDGTAKEEFAQARGKRVSLGLH